MSTFTENTQLLQRFAGTAPDGQFGPKTAAALVEKLRLTPTELHPQPAPNGNAKRKVCIDPGHGMANRRAGVYDGGCERGDLQEADIALVWANALADELKNLGVNVFFTRRDNQRPTPVGSRAGLAQEAGCDMLVSIHVNDADGTTATGTETLYSGSDDIPLARRCQDAMLTGLGLRDRGIKQRTDLAVLKFQGRAVLLELGFIGTDAATITDKSKIDATVKLLAAAIAG